MARHLLKLFAFGIFVMFVTGQSYNFYGDTQVINSNGKLICDQIECPVGTVRCEVIKKKSKKSASVLVRQNFCYGDKNQVLKELTNEEPIDPNQNINIHIIRGINGGFSSYASSIESNGPGIGPGLGTWSDANISPDFYQPDFQFADFNKNLQQNIQQNIDSVLENTRRGLAQTFQGLF